MVAFASFAFHMDGGTARIPGVASRIFVFVSVYVFPSSLIPQQNQGPRCCATLSKVNVQIEYLKLLPCPCQSTSELKIHVSGTSYGEPRL